MEYVVIDYVYIYGKTYIFRKDRMRYFGMDEILVFVV